MVSSFSNYVKAIQYKLEEHFNPGDRVELIFGIPTPIQDEDLSAFSRVLNTSGLNASISYGNTEDWPNAIQMKFRRLRRKDFPFADILTNALAKLNIKEILGYRIV